MGFMSNFVDGFRQAEEPNMLGTGTGNYDNTGKIGPLEDVEKTSSDKADDYENGGGHAKIQTPGANTALKRHLTGRHMQMIAFGGSIGTGLFIGSGGALASGGPGFLLIDFLLIGAMLFCVVMALGELATVLPVSGSFASYSTRFLDPSWGFAMGWNYWMQWFIVLPLELTAATIVLEYWPGSTSCPQGVYVLVFLLAIVFINMFGVRGYGEFEFVASMVKIIAVTGFIIAAIVIDVGGAPDGVYKGAHTWHDPGAFHNGFKGFVSIFVTAAFAFAGTELVGLAAAETGNPRKEVPKASKQIFWRVAIFYIVNLFLVGLIVPYTDPQLLSGTSSYDARASPFVIAIELGQIKALPSIFNAVILISVLSVGNSAVYGASRTLCGLAQAGQAPKIFAYIDREGRPLPAVFLSLLMGCLAFVIYASNSSTIFNWLLAISGLSSIFTWGSLCFCHIQFRRAWKYNGHTVEELPWASPVGVYGSWFGGLFCILVVIFQFYIAAFPIGEGELGPSDRATDFFQAFLAVPVVIFFYVPYKLWFKTPFVKVSEMDITTGRLEYISLETLREERAEENSRPIYKRMYGALF
ncbi:hypothetical protein CBS101457_004322 [Exobasidium rhododendri]|nr:hypothetical protein CBS101457_004322 [Exobasidium rhododendri]